MKKLLTIVALAATVFSAPALARTSAKAAGEAPTAWQSYAQDRASTPSYAQYGQSAHSPNPAFDVYSEGRYVGSDPDPNVRMMLQFDGAEEN